MSDIDPTKESLSGFLLSSPKRSMTEKRVTRMFVYVAKPRTTHDRVPSTEPEKYELVAFGETAEATLRKFARGDNFIAEGRMYTRQRVIDGEPVEVKQFVATRIGHDAARNTYEVDRTRRAKRTVERSRPVTQVAQSTPPAAPSRAI